MRNASIVALFALLCSGYAAANTQLPRLLMNEAPELRVVGKGEMRWFGFHLYDATLWLSDRTWAVDGTYALAIEYARDIAGSQLVERSIAEMRRLGVQDERKLARWAAQMARVFPDVKKGDRIVGAHLPGRGASFFHQEQLTGSIEDTEFARTFFAIWLDPRTREPSLRKALLGEK